MFFVNFWGLGYYYIYIFYGEKKCYFCRCCCYGRNFCSLLNIYSFGFIYDILLPCDFIALTFFMFYFTPDNDDELFNNYELNLFYTTGCYFLTDYCEDTFVFLINESNKLDCLIFFNCFFILKFGLYKARQRKLN